jgi:hypothetical protein
VTRGRHYSESRALGGGSPCGWRHAPVGREEGVGWGARCVALSRRSERASNQVGDARTGREAGVGGAAPHPRHEIGVRSDKTPEGLLHALEWTRTTTGKTPHKALNPIHPPLMGPATSRSSSLPASQDVSDVSGGATSSEFCHVLKRAPVGVRCPCGPAPLERVAPAPVAARAVPLSDVAAQRRCFCSSSPPSA